ncbi:hypothetical protein BJV82DRAFT_584375 [Fennellomyces sp. T-0311]|nr:hypothetical protein BJV82DRAFT_584375 [Fennellomyces sp. T-0311]
MDIDSIQREKRPRVATELSASERDAADGLVGMHTSAPTVASMVRTFSDLNMSNDRNHGAHSDYSQVDWEGDVNMEGSDDDSSSTPLPEELVQGPTPAVSLEQPPAAPEQQVVSQNTASTADDSPAAAPTRIKKGKQRKLYNGPKSGAIEAALKDLLAGKGLTLTAEDHNININTLRSRARAFEETGTFEKKKTGPTKKNPPTFTDAIIAKARAEGKEVKTREMKEKPIVTKMAYLAAIHRKGAYIQYKELTWDE